MEIKIRFYKNAKQEWYADIPDWGGAIEDLQMVEGADKMLDWIAGSDEECSLMMSNDSLADAELLTLVYLREANLGGGGDYLLETLKGEIVHHKLWLCHVTHFVFKEVPEKIFFRKV